MKTSYIFEHLNENQFNKLEKSVKKYNMGAYKKLIFDYFPALKNGKFLGKLIAVNSRDQIESYELKLPTDEMFAKVHGEMVLYYDVYKEKGIVLLKTINPEDILTEGHKTELETYKGVMISKSNAERDMFKVDLLRMLKR